VTWFARLYLWATYRLYDELAWAYDWVSWLVSLGHWSLWRQSALGHVEGQQVLETGFGTGELLIEMVGHGLDVVGLEMSPAMHRVTGRKLGRRGVIVPRVLGPVQRMPFADGCFDTIVSTFPSGYILEAAALEEIARLLRPPDPAGSPSGGRLVVVGLVTRWQQPSWRRVMDLLFGVGDVGVLERFERLATASGLQVQVIDPGGKGLRVPVVVAKRG
jgi:phosphatidylethanolamine/phosphatidyl-N-methylethanolamine N-methyltransferase